MDLEEKERTGERSETTHRDLKTQWGLKGKKDLILGLKGSLINEEGCVRV